jgi:hypothetical protein
MSGTPTASLASIPTAANTAAAGHTVLQRGQAPAVLDAGVAPQALWQACKPQSQGSVQGCDADRPCRQHAQRILAERVRPGRARPDCSQPRRPAMTTGRGGGERNRAFCEFFLPKLCGGDCVGIPRGRQCTRSASEPLTLARSRIPCACERGVRSAGGCDGRRAGGGVRCRDFARAPLVAKRAGGVVVEVPERKQVPVNIRTHSAKIRRRRCSHDSTYNLYGGNSPPPSRSERRLQRRTRALCMHWIHSGHPSDTQRRTGVRRRGMGRTLRAHRRMGCCHAIAGLRDGGEGGRRRLAR